MIIEKAGLQFTMLIHIGTEAKSIVECEKYKFQFLFLVA